MKQSIALELVNKQEPEGPMTNEHEVEVFKIWRTIQGEGPFAGHADLFIRLAGCNLKCAGCDTDYTSKRTVAPVKEVVEAAAGLMPGLALIVITGGEPFRQAGSGMLIRDLLLKNPSWIVQIETNGVLGLPANFPEDMKDRVFIVVSPKRGYVHKKLYPYVSALKYVIQSGCVDPKDGLPTAVLDTEVPIAKPWPEYNGLVFVMPYDSRNPDEWGKHVYEAVKSCMMFGYRLGVQIHKVIGME